MYQKKLLLSTILLMCIGLALTNAQEIVSASGGNGSGGGGSVSYSVGQVVYSSYNDATGSVIQGVQQPYEISVITSIEKAPGIQLSFSVFPNPATDFIKLRVGSYESDNLTFQLYDANGNLLENRKIEGSETSISMENRVTSIYYLKINDNNKELKSFKIIKK